MQGERIASFIYWILSLLAEMSPYIYSFYFWGVLNMKQGLKTVTLRLLPTKTAYRNILTG